MLRADILSWHHPSLINSKYANHSVASKAFQNVWMGWAGGLWHPNGLFRCLPNSYVIWWGRGWHRFFVAKAGLFLVQCCVWLCTWDCVRGREGGMKGAMASLCDPQIEHSQLWSSWNIQKADRHVCCKLKQPSVSPSLPAFFIFISCSPS